MTDHLPPGADGDPAPDVSTDPSVESTGDHQEDTAASATDTVDGGPDLDAITADLDAVDAALARLADGTYWTDEVTGDPIADATLVADPLRRRA